MLEYIATDFYTSCPLLEAIRIDVACCIVVAILIIIDSIPFRYNTVFLPHLLIASTSMTNLTKNLLTYCDIGEDT